MEEMYMEQIKKTAANSDLLKDFLHDIDVKAGRKTSWDELNSINWEQIEELVTWYPVRKDDQPSGCYVTLKRIILIDATDEQIRECISMSGENLRILDLSFSPIAEIPEEIRNLYSLRYLGLSGLHLRTLPDWLPEIAEDFSLDFDWKSGKQKALIYLGNTSVEDIPDMSIFNQPYEVITEWFAQRKFGRTQALNEIKVVFLGDGESGKSHILSRLLNDGGAPVGYTDMSTPGIVIKHKQHMFNGREFQVNYWDFGGQEILHSMHRIFLTSRTMYVVVLNARDDTHGERAMYWLQNIRSFAPNAPVLLVLNKIDQNPKATVDERYLRARFPMLTQIVHLSALEYDDEHFNQEFTAVLLDEIIKTGYLDAQWPASWFKLKQSLEKMQSHYIVGGSYLELCHEAGVDTNQRNLLHWFNDLGISFCFNDDEDYGLSDHIVLRPDWITNAMYIILFNQLEGSKNGLVPHRSIFRLLTNAYHNAHIHCTLPQAMYSVADVQYILGIMRKFRLSLPYGGDNEFIPMLCQQSPTIDIHDYEDDDKSLEFHMKFEYVPDNLLHRLMVERHEELNISNTWRRGAQFVQQETGLSSAVVIDDNVLKFFIRHGVGIHRPNTYLAMLKANVDRIVEKMGLLKPQNFLIYKIYGKRISFNYDRLVKMRERGHPEEYCVELDLVLSIDDILNQSAPEDLQDHQLLLKALVHSCHNIQAEPSYQTIGDDLIDRSRMDMRIRRIRDDLVMRGYRVADQTQWGQSDRRKPFGELNLHLLNDQGETYTVINTTCVPMNGSFGDWNQNLTKLLYNVSHYGMSTMFLVNFVETGPAGFARLKEIYRSHLQHYDPARAKLVRGSYAEFTEGIPAQYTVKCAYHVGGHQITIYYLFVALYCPGERTVPKMQPKPTQIDAPGSSEVVLKEGRVVFLGDSEAGKSLLMARLKNPQMDPSDFSGDTTPGINIFNEIIIHKGQRIRVNYWDFGGQEVLHSMHRMFLSTRTLYVIVLNTRNDNQDAQADFWMRYVQSYALGAPVLLVLNKIDQNPKAALNFPVLHRRFPEGITPENVLKISAVEKDPDKFREMFTDKLHDFIKQHIDRFQGFTTREALIRQRVDDARERVAISRSKFKAFCSAEGLEEKEDRDDLIGRFHDAGIIVYFQEGTPMYLNPAWITETLYMVLSADTKDITNGLVSHKYLEAMCDKNKNQLEGEDDAQHLIQIMQKYDLSFQHGNQEFIPMLCQREEPEEIEDLIQAPDTQELQLVFEYLPSGLLYKLMVDYKDDLDIDKTWFTGAKIGRGKTEYIILRRNGNTLCIYTNFTKKDEGRKKRDIIAGKIEKLVDESKYHATLLEKKIKFTMYNSAQYFDLALLQDAENCDVHYTVFPGKNPTRIAIRDVLDQEDRSRERATSKLLQDVAVVCTQLQQRAAFMDSQEDVRNNKLLDALKNKEYDIAGQVQIGEAPSGKRQNELDFLIRYSEGDPWTIMEALNVSTKTAMTYWDKHMNKLVGRYNASFGLQKLVLISYVDCVEDSFKDMYQKFSGHMKGFNPENYQIKSDAFDHCASLSNDNNYLQVDQCTYTRNDQPVTVYHYFVRMGDKEPPEENPVE